ncbi:hypothetical protein KIS4809_4446 [Bacillus sp. ZZV12-4809]|nr:hypothetical protein KIS4809_4446 [Bacillus sp. ZZV12-4809]
MKESSLLTPKKGRKLDVPDHLQMIFSILISGQRKLFYPAIKVKIPCTARTGLAMGEKKQPH